MQPIELDHLEIPAQPFTSGTAPIPDGYGEIFAPPLDLPVVPDASSPGASADPPPGPEARIAGGVDPDDEELFALFGSDGEDGPPLPASVNTEVTT